MIFLRSNKLNIFICISCGIVILGLIVFPMGPEKLFSALSSLDLRWIGGAFGCVILYWLLESAALHTIIKAAYKKQRFIDSFSVNMGGQYFHAITPFSSGGQPFQAYFLKKQGLELGVAINCLVAKFIIYQFSFLFVTTLLLIVRFSYFKDILDNFFFLVIAGYGVNLLVTAWAFGLIFFKNTTRRFSFFVINILSFLHIVKDPGSKKKYMEKELIKFDRSFHEMIKDIPSMIRAFVFSVMHTFAAFSVPYMIYRAFGASDIGPLTIICAQSFVSLISSFVPIPGAGIGAEGAFFFFFKSFFKSASDTGIALILWRAVYFYFTVFAGAVFAVKANKKTKDPHNK